VTASAWTEDAAPKEPELRTYLRTLRRRKWIVIVVTIIGLAGATGYSFLQTPKYTATAQVLLQPTAEPGASQAAASGLTPTDVETQVQLVTSAPVKQAVERQLRVASAPSVAVTSVTNTNVLQISATSTNPHRASTVANAYAGAYVNYSQAQVVNQLLGAAQQIQAKINSLNQQIAASNSPSQKSALSSQVAALTTQLQQLQVNTSLVGGGAQLVASASVPSSPSSPSPKRDAAIGFVVGLVVGLGLAFVVEYLDDSIKTKEDLEQAAPGLATLALVPAVAGWRDQRSSFLVTKVSPRSPAAEAYRSLRTSISFLGVDSPIRTVQVTSPSAREGKTTTVANLGIALAEAGRRVTVVCCDLRRPRIHEFFGLANDVGFTSVVMGEAGLSGALQAVPGIEGLSVLASGPTPDNPSELLASRRAAEVLASAAHQADLVLLDTPPVLPVTDAAVLSARADAVLLVLAAGRTTTRQLTRSLELLSQVGAPTVGTVLNGVSRDTAYGYGYGYRYGYSYAYAAEPTGNGRNGKTVTVGGDRVLGDRQGGGPRA
jgi:succinoglycan biosynthesis transport protein ExoP